MDSTLSIFITTDFQTNRGQRRTMHGSAFRDYAKKAARCAPPFKSLDGRLIQDQEEELVET
jgi:hypothetical protein